MCCFDLGSLPLDPMISVCLVYHYQRKIYLLKAQNAKGTICVFCILYLEKISLPLTMINQIHSKSCVIWVAYIYIYI